jgi:hypothetical protein
LQLNALRGKTDFYENHIKYTIHSVTKMQSFNVLKQVVHVGTIGFKRVKTKRVKGEKKQVMEKRKAERGQQKER